VSSLETQYFKIYAPLSKDITILQNLYPDRTCFIKTREEVRVRLYKLVYIETGMDVNNYHLPEYYEKWGIPQPQFAYDIKVPDLSNTIENIMKNIDEGKLDNIHLESVAQSVINGYLYEKLNPPKPAPKAPPAPPLVIQTGHVTLSIPPLK
jgi:hypothetical protein